MKFYCLIFSSVLLSCSTQYESAFTEANGLTNPVIAYRGAWKNKNDPENSIASLNNTIALKCAGSESDVRMTADDLLMFNHDASYNHLVIEKSKYAGMAKCKHINGEKLVTLGGYLKTGAKKESSEKLFWEIKSLDISKKQGKLMAGKVAQTFYQPGMEEAVEYLRFDDDLLLKIVELEPSAKTNFPDGSKSPRLLKEDRISGIDYPVYKKHINWFESAKRNNINLDAWTANDPEDKGCLLANGFDFITTKDTELLIQRIKDSPTPSGWKLTWSEEFNYTGLPDSTIWNYAEGGNGFGNRELQYYTKADSNNAYVKEGKLIISALKQTKGKNEYTSARLNSQNKAEFQYGRIEVRAKLPAGRGTWPAIWMLGKNRAKAGWPACGEIDIMEHVGYDKDSIHGTIHTEVYNHMKGTQKGKTIFIKNPYTEFHIFSIEWTPEKIDFMLDGVLYNHIENEHLSVKEWPFDQPFYFILNLAVGGNWGGKKGIDETIFPAVMEVDYVRVFTK